MPSENFTRRELQVLDALCSLPFRSQTEIALDLGIAARTLRSHISTMLSKAGMADQRELVVTETSAHGAPRYNAHEPGGRSLSACSYCGTQGDGQTCSQCGAPRTQAGKLVLPKADNTRERK